MIRYLIARCPNCSRHCFQACTLPENRPHPVFDPELCVILKCDNCAQEFHWLASLLEDYRSAHEAETGSR